MACSIEWHDVVPKDWDTRFEGVRRSTLLQSRLYARALCPAQGQRARHGLIRIDGDAAGLVQIQEASLFRRAVHGLILDRGPLWLDGFGHGSHIRLFFEAFTRQFPARFGRRRRVIPEVPKDQRTTALDGLDLCHVDGQTPYQTFWLDLRPDQDAIRASLKSKWRNMLNKAEKSEMEIRWSWDGAGLATLLGAYANDKSSRGYAGPEPRTLALLAREFAPLGQMGIGFVRRKGIPIAGLMVLTHGASATYQMGFVAPEGRTAAANYRLLWELVVALKARGIKDLDLGGVNDGDAAGVKKFKAGLAGELVEYAGQFR